MTKIASVKFKKYIADDSILKFGKKQKLHLLNSWKFCPKLFQGLESKQGRYRWGGSWAGSSESTLFAKSAVCIFGALSVNSH